MLHVLIIKCFGCYFAKHMELSDYFYILLIYFWKLLYNITWGKEEKHLLFFFSLYFTFLYLSSLKIETRTNSQLNRYLGMMVTISRKKSLSAIDLQKKCSKNSYGKKIITHISITTFSFFDHFQFSNQKLKKFPPQFLWMIQDTSLKYTISQLNLTALLSLQTLLTHNSRTGLTRLKLFLFVKLQLNL